MTSLPCYSGITTGSSFGVASSVAGRKTSRIFHSFRAAGNKQFVCPGDGKEQPERYAYQQNGIWLQITASQQRKLDPPFPIHLLSLHRSKWRCR